MSFSNLQHDGHVEVGGKRKLSAIVSRISRSIFKRHTVVVYLLRCHLPRCHLQVSQLITGTAWPFFHRISLFTMVLIVSFFFSLPKYLRNKLFLLG